MTKIPTIEEQVESLKSLDYETLVKTYIGIDLRTNKIIDYKKLFSHVYTVKKSEIKKYLQDHYSLDELVPIVPDLNPPFPEKELWALKVKDGYEVYNFDLGKFAGKTILSNEDAVLDYYIEHITNGSGTVKFKE